MFTFQTRQFEAGGIDTGKLHICMLPWKWGLHEK